MEKKAECGGKCGVFLAKWERSTSTWKTRQLSLFAASETSLERWPREGGMRNGSCWERPTVVPHISANASGSWLATPTAAQNQIAESMLNRPKNRRWLPTPTTQDAKNDGSISQQNRDCLNGLLRGPPHPEFVELLMGWPLSWTDASASGPLVTDRFHEWLRRHSLPSGEGCTADSNKDEKGAP